MPCQAGHVAGILFTSLGPPPQLPGRGKYTPCQAIWPSSVVHYHLVFQYHPPPPLLQGGREVHPTRLCGPVGLLSCSLTMGAPPPQLPVRGSRHPARLWPSMVSLCVIGLCFQCSTPSPPATRGEGGMSPGQCTWENFWFISLYGAPNPVPLAGYGEGGITHQASPAGFLECSSVYYESPPPQLPVRGGRHPARL